MRILVAWASKHGATAEIAAALADEFRELGIAADVHEADSVVDVAPYDAVVLGSAVYAGHWASGAKDFLEWNRATIATRPLWLFSSGPLGDPPKPAEDPIDALAAIRESGARGHRIFAGKLDREKLGFGERALVKFVHAPYGDFRDWDEIRAWAHEIAAALPEPATPR